MILTNRKALVVALSKNGPDSHYCQMFFSSSRRNRRLQTSAKAALITLNAHTTPYPAM